MKNNYRKRRKKREKIKPIINLSLGIIIGITAPTIYKLVKENYPLFGYDEKNTIIITDNSQLDELYMENITFFDVRKTLKNNNNIQEKYRTYINEYIDALEERLPKVDLRIFNKNLENLTIKIVPPAVLEDSGIAGYYNYSENFITLKSTYSSPEIEKRVIFHELTHATNSGTYEKVKINDKYYFVNKTYQDTEKKHGIGTMEAMTEIITDYLLSENYKKYFKQDTHYYLSYPEEANTVYQLLKLTDDYSIYDYFNSDIYKLENNIDDYNLDKIINMIDKEGVGLEGYDLNYYQNRLLEEGLKKKIEEENQDELSSYKRMKNMNICTSKERMEIVDNLYPDSFIDIIKIDDTPKEEIKSYFYNNGKIEIKNIIPPSTININIYNGDYKISNSNPEDLFFYKQDLVYHIGYIINKKYYDIITKKEIDATHKDIIYLDEFLEYYIGINYGNNMNYNIKLDISKLVDEEVEEHIDFQRFLKYIAP